MHSDISTTWARVPTGALVHTILAPWVCAVCTPLQATTPGPRCVITSDRAMGSTARGLQCLPSRVDKWHPCSPGRLGLV
jgi:hypothetical protein